MDKTEAKQAFKILEYIKDNEFKTEGASLKETYINSALDKETFKSIINYLERKGYVIPQEWDYDDFFKEGLAESEPAHSKASTTDSGRAELYSRERQKIENELNASILKTNKMQVISAVLTIGFSAVAALISLISLIKGTFIELKHSCSESQNPAQKTGMPLPNRQEIPLYPAISVIDSLKKKY